MHLLQILLAATLMTSTATAANLSQEQRISHRLNGPDLIGEALWLTAGQVRFFAIFQKSNAERVLGNAILLHEAGNHADWPEVTAPLRHHLADRGWDTLSLQLPRPIDPTSEPDRKEAIKLAGERLQAAIAHLNTAEGTALVLVGHGLGAEMALAYIATNPNERLHALVAIGLAAGEENNEEPVLQAISQLQRPMLDLYGDRDLPPVINTAQARRNAAKRNQQETYRQDRVMGADHHFRGLQQSLLQRIASWLRRVAQESLSDTN
jgi:pimeloyl-ACP methyl ester carboxylesterase